MYVLIKQYQSKKAFLSVHHSKYLESIPKTVLFSLNLMDTA